METLPDTANGPMISSLKKIQQLNAEAQEKYPIGAPEWRFFEDMDDLIHNKLTELGD